MQDKVVKYSVLFMALVLSAIVLQTLAEVLPPLAIAVLLLFVFTPLASYSKEKSIPAWLTFSGLLVAVILPLSFAGSFFHFWDRPHRQVTRDEGRLILTPEPWRILTNFGLDSFKMKAY